MADLHLDEITSCFDRAKASVDASSPVATASMILCAGFVPRLVAEVRRLRAENEHLRHGGSVPPPITSGASD